MGSPISTSPWSAASWRRFPAAQQPVWPDAEALKKAEAQLSTLPPLVFAGEAKIRIELRDWSLIVEDFGEAWPASCAPCHDGTQKSA